MPFRKATFTQCYPKYVMSSAVSAAMYKLALIMTIFTMSARAADFRALDIGQSCALAREWEVSKGSIPTPGRKGPGADIYAFEGRDFDRELSFSYFCIDGNLFAGNYFFQSNH